MDAEAGGRILTTLPASSVAAILRHTPEPDPVLQALPETMRVMVGGLLRFPEGTAGALADPGILTVPDHSSVGDAQKLLQRTPERAVASLYVLDREHHLLGVVRLADLLTRPAGDAVATVTRSDVPRVPARADRRTVATDPVWLEHDELPVVDATGVFLGVLRHRALRRRSAGEAGGAVDLAPLVGLAELYWTSFSRLLLGIGEAGPTRRGERMHEETSP